MGAFRYCRITTCYVTFPPLFAAHRSLGLTVFNLILIFATKIICSILKTNCSNDIPARSRTMQISAETCKRKNTVHSVT